MSVDKIQAYYSTEFEKHRLDLEFFKLEGIRTKEIIERYINRSNLKILDVGGGAGYYAFWLQEKGHSVTLVDLSPTNIELVEKKAKQTDTQLTQALVGDATKLTLEENQFDVVLMLGPLYHLIEKKDRVKALSEAKRVLKPGGVLLSAVISRYASLFDGFKRNLVGDPKFLKMLHGDLRSGVHLNDTDNFEYFTTAYFHTPAQIREEIKESGLTYDKLVAIESFGWALDDFNSKAQDAAYMETLMLFLHEVESNDDLIAMSPHIMAVSKK